MFVLFYIYTPGISPEQRLSPPAWLPSPGAAKIQLFKGTVQQDFRSTVLFHHSNLPWPLTNGLKCFRFWGRIRRVIRILGSKKTRLPGV